MARQPTVFHRRSLLLIFLIGGLAFAAMLALLVANSGREQGHPTGPNAFSRSAIGHMAFAELIDRAGIPMAINQGALATRVHNDTLVIVAEPSGPEAAETINQDLAQAGAALLVLPKWQGVAAASPAEWIDRARPVPRSLVREILDIFTTGAKVYRAESTAPWSINAFGGNPAVDAPQFIQSTRLRPLVGNADGLLLGEAQFHDFRLWILSDPDVIANHGIGHGDNATFALEIIEALRPEGGPVLVDATLHGFRRTESLWRTILAPPFLPMAIQAALATALLGWAAAVRFGRPEPLPPSLTPGTTTLVRIGARLLRDQGDGSFLIRAYAASAVSDVVRRLRLNRPASDPDLAAWLDRIGESRGTKYRYSDLMRQAAALRGRDGNWAADAVSLARRLDRWKRDLTYGS